jgi:hypothetical protein
VLQTIDDDVGFGTLFREYSGNIFKEIDSAAFTNIACTLFVTTTGALISQRGVTSPAEPEDVAPFIPAFRTVHSLIHALNIEASRLMLRIGSRTEYPR